MTSDELWLSIGDLAERTGVSVPTLRAWESRHGFPVPVRRPSGHRRYRSGDVDRVREVVRHRDAGMRLDTAIARVVGAVDPVVPVDGSVFATLRRDYPHLPVERLHKATLTALSWAIEDEFCAKADRAHLFGAFQQARHFAPSRRRWEELARVAGSAFVLAGFDDEGQEAAAADAHVVRVPLPVGSPMRREWAVVCDSAELPVVLTAWELPGQELVPDERRLFEAIWSVEPGPVRLAARLCAGVAAGADPAAAAPVLFALADEPVRSTPDLAALNTMFTRVLRYVDRRGPHAERL